MAVWPGQFAESGEHSGCHAAAAPVVETAQPRTKMPSANRFTMNTPSIEKSAPSDIREIERKIAGARRSGDRDTTHSIVERASGRAARWSDLLGTVDTSFPPAWLQFPLPGWPALPHPEWVWFPMASSSVRETCSVDALAARLL